MRKDYKAGKRFRKHKIRDYRRRAGKFKNPLFTTKREKLMQLKLAKKRIIIAVSVVIGAGLVYFFLISPYFYISKVEVFGLETIQGKDFQNLVDDFLNSRRLFIFPNRNSLVMNKGKLRRTIEGEYVFDDLKIDRKFPNQLNIEVQERISNAILTMGSNYYYLDSRGIILRRIGESEIYPGMTIGPHSGEVPEFESNLEKLNLPLIYVQSYSTVTIGEQFLSYEKYVSILESKEILTLYTPYEVDFNKITDIHANWFKLVTTGGWEIHLDLEKNLQTQIVKVHTFIQEQGLNPADYQYFNARYEDRIYYK